MSEIVSNLSRMRAERGVSAVRLAQAAGITRQTVYAIEAGHFVPNTLVALRLARALDTTVEDLFRPSEMPAPAIRRAHLLPGSEEPFPLQPVEVCDVDGKAVAFAPQPATWCLPQTNGFVESYKQGRLSVRTSEALAQNRLLMAGCDPAMSLFARYAESAGVELVLVHRNSTEALRLLREGDIHIAGTHLTHQPMPSTAVVSFAVWEEGIVTARGNPKKIGSIADLARRGVSVVNREPGSGMRVLLDAELRRLAIDPKRIKGYQQQALGHLAVATQVQRGQADACLATGAVARALGLHFQPIRSQRYDLVLHKKHLSLPAMQSLFHTLNQGRFRRELEGLGGYETQTTGQRFV